MTPGRRYLPALATLLLAFLVLNLLPAVAQATCAAPKNAIEAENCLQGTPASQWYVQAAGSPNIQGFATDASVNVGQTIFFKISTPAASYRIDIYRLGYYQGNGARFITSVFPSVPLPQLQPPCLADNATGLIDCGNWGISASWTVPSTATSGIYFVRLVRLDTGEVGAILFIVRDDSSHSDILQQTSDTTWQAYNDYGGNSLYSGNPAGRSYKVSYNRPVNTLNHFFIYEYPMFRFLEANGYDVTYSTGVDTDRYGALITQHKVFVSVGHDEYWSGGQRANVEAARAAGVHLAFFSGNEVFWKTRWEPSIDGTNAPYRTLVCYKEPNTGAIDPADPPTWTGLWRDARFSPPGDGGRPENALTGTIFQVANPQDDAITVPQADGRMRFWRNTDIATLGPGQVATLPKGTLGYESDEDVDNGFRPAGLIRLSTTTVPVASYFYFSPTSGYYTAPGTQTHHLTLYRAPSGALVFGAGTVQYGWGVDSSHGAYSGLPPDPNMQQATVNLLADMGVQPATLQSSLVPATASTDTSPPSSTITSPAPGTTASAGSQVTVSGTAQDFGGGVVGGVEVSVDGGATWHPAVGRENWSYVFTAATSGSLTVQSRAVDDTCNLEVAYPTIITQPANQTVTAGQTATFTAAATGSPTPTVQWQVSTDGGVTFSNVSGATSTTLSFTTALSQDGNRYGAVFTNSAGTATTTAATLTVNSPALPTITNQPANQTVNAGQTATFTAAATGSPTPTVQWQVSTDGGATFGNVSGATSTTLSFTTILSQNGNQYRAVFTNSAGTATTTAATLTVNPTPPTITAQLTYPANGASNVDPWAAFTWTTVSIAQSYTIWIGTSPGSSNIYNSGPLTTTSQSVPGLRQNTTYYARLFTQTSQGSSYEDSSFSTGLGMAHLITPAPGASSVDPYQAFTWNSVPGAQLHYVYVGTSPGQKEVFNSGELAPTITSRLASGLLGGQAYYVTLWTYINNTWYSVASSFSTAPQPLPSDANAFRSTVQQQTGNVRLMTQGATNLPIPGTLLAQIVAEDGVAYAFCTEYATTLAQLLIGQRISVRIRNLGFDGVNYESHVTTEYYDPFLTKWIVADPTFGVVYWNAGATSGMSIDELSSAVAAKNWTYIQPFITYTTSNGNLYSHNYYMDPLLLYLNPFPLGVQAFQLPLANSPEPFFTVHADTDIGKSGIWLFSFVNQTDSVTLSGGSQYGPLGGTIYSQAVTLSTGWSITSRPSGMRILTMNRYLYP